MPRVIHEQKSLAIVLSVILINARTALVNRLLNILVGGIAQGCDLISREHQTAQTGNDYLDVIHGLIDIDEAFLALDQAQLVVLAASDDNGSLLLRLEVLPDVSAAQVELLLDAAPAAYVIDRVACLNHNKNFNIENTKWIICNTYFLI